MENLLAWGLTTLVGAFVGSYLSGYLKKKGENLATHEDIDKLVEQANATTEATKSIEARILDEVWGRQRQWDITREVAFKLMESHDRLEHAREDFTAFKRYEVITDDDVPTLQELSHHWKDELRAMIDCVGAAEFVCWSKDASQAAHDYLTLLKKLRDLPSYKVKTQILEQAGLLAQTFGTLRDAIRRELRLQRKESENPPATSQSSGSSATPTPG